MAFFSTGYEVWAKVAGAAEPTNPTFTKSGSTNMAVTVFEVTGIDPNHPFDCWASHSDSANNTTAELPSLQADENGTLAIAMWEWFTAQGAAPTYPTGFVEQSYIAQSLGHATATKTLSAVGDTGVLNATLNTSSGVKAAAVILRSPDATGTNLLLKTMQHFSHSGGAL